MAGRQYIAIQTGWGGAFAIAAGEIALGKRAPTNIPRMLVYALDGKDTLAAGAEPRGPAAEAATPIRRCSNRWPGECGSIIPTAPIAMVTQP